MRLVDHQIDELCRAGMVKPYDPALLNPASLDVRLGDTLLIESAESPALVPYPLHHHSQEFPYLAQPSQFVLGATIETFYLPDTIEAEFVLKSSRGREGYQHMLSAYCDPGWWESVLTVELHNSRQLHPIPLWPGMRIGQMKFARLAVPPRRSYRVTGRYNGDATVQGSKG